MSAFAMYRLPGENYATKVVQDEGEPEIIPSVATLDGKEGFVMAPFAPSDECPALLLHPNRTEQFATTGEESHSPNISTEGEEVRSPNTFTASDEDKARYAQDFLAFHEQLEAGAFQKIVLARCTSVQASPLSMEDLFLRSCRLYPRLFVALVSTAQSGAWLMATPEVLLSGENDTFSTMALAGTQKKPEWSAKNREEQQYVTDYIADCIKGIADNYAVHGPYTVQAAQLYHLRTDFTFRFRDTGHLGTLLDKLFPTPAVCGIPKEAARQFILTHEQMPRKYYSGFVGPLAMDGKTRLFVSLRCMNILQGGVCELYAGGGLLKKSDMEQEWAETEDKMQTMLQLLKVKG